MRRENSDFGTKFVTSPGDFKVNKDYFAYVELDDYVCWVLADGLDSANDRISSEIVVNSILNDFAEDPSLKKRKIKKYIKNANQRLEEESSTMSLQSTVLVVVSDYHSLRWGYVGNTRLYHLRKDKIKRKTKDHSIAEMMLEVGDIGPQQLNQHQERNNLNKYLGQEKGVSPTISKKFQLEDDDTLILCTSGFWEHLSDRDLETDLEEIKEVQELVDNLELKMLSQAENSLDNYSIVAVFANKVLQEKVGKKFSWKKAVAILLPILFLSGGAFLYNKRVSRIRVKVMSAKSKLNRANRLVKKGQGREARPELQKSKESFKKLGKEEEVAKINQQLELVDAQELEEKGDQKVKDKEYVKALSDYKEAKLIYLKVGDYNLKEIEDKIFRLNRILKAKDYEREGLEAHSSQNYSEAKQKYSLALEIYREFSLKDEVEKIEEQLEKIKQRISQDDQDEKIKEIKAEANEYLQIGDYKSAINKYIEAKVICSNLGLSKEVSKINKKIKQINNRSTIQKAEEYEDSAAIELNKDNFSEALFNYKQAEKIYSECSLSSKVAKVRKKIESIKSAQSLTEAETLEEVGDKQFDNQKYEQALSNYKESKSIYKNAKLDDEANKIGEKIISVEVAKTFNKAKEYEKIGDQLAEEENYKKAIMNYNEAKSIYNKVNKLKDFNRIQKKIEKANDGKEGFFERLFS
ncbi:MAG: protein phosphatase 2C domain-containing protein [Halanaerobacter sp.]